MTGLAFAYRSCRRTDLTPLRDICYCKRSSRYSFSFISRNINRCEPLTLADPLTEDDSLDEQRREEHDMYDEGTTIDHSFHHENVFV